MMKQIFLTLVTCLLLLSCSNSKRQPFLLQGGWTLSRVEFPYDREDVNYPYNGITHLRLYDGDSTMVQCQLTRTASAIVIQPSAKYSITLIDKGGGERLYLEDDNPRPLTAVDDTTMVIQSHGVLYTWHRADDITQEWGDEIRSIVNNELQEGNLSDRHYVLSAKERKQASFIHWLILAISMLMMVFAQVTIANRRARRRLQTQLQQIQEEYEKRPQPIKKAIETVETTFFESDDYHSLQHRIATGQRLKEEEWDGIEELLRKVYPGFSGQLHNLYEMSELEYQVCVLTKLRISPSNIAAVLVRDISTISSVRSRLYKKVFGKKGGAKEWDEFILSIGA